MFNTMHESVKAFLALKERALKDLALPKTNHRDSAPKTIRLGSWEVGIYVNLCITNAQCLQWSSQLGAHNCEVNITTPA